MQVDNLAWRLPVRQGYLVRQVVGYVRLLEGISFDLHGGEMLALVGESGSGKSSLARAIVCLEQPTSGRVRYRGQDLLQLAGEPLRRHRRELQLLFQEARASLNPTMKVGEILVEALESQNPANQPDRIQRMLSQVGLSPELSACLPGVLSDEQCQRLCLARALAASPEVIIYDAPVHPADGSAQLQMLRLLKELQRSLSLACLVLARDPALAFQFADRIGILYSGRLVELGRRDELHHSPLHPYTRALLSALPSIKTGLAEKAAPLPGEPPPAGRLPGGCPFHPRCRLVQPVCQEIDPQWRQHSPGHWAACHMV